jgi:hypothetical protein
MLKPMQNMKAGASALLQQDWLQFLQVMWVRHLTIRLACAGMCAPVFFSLRLPASGGVATTPTCRCADPFLFCSLQHNGGHSHYTQAGCSSGHAAAVTQCKADAGHEPE